MSTDFSVKAVLPRVNNCRICRCSLDTAPVRAWVVLKQSRTSTAWFGTLASASGSEKGVPVTSGEEDKASESGVEDNEENVSASEERPRLHRRQRGGAGEGGVMASPDLLTIPGVGPRNLRKLVQKGFMGVDQLKQLYIDKV